MKKIVYSDLFAILKQFMEISTKNNLVWGNEEYSTILYKEAGYEVIDWSWYDGPIIKLKSTQFSDIEINYAACASSYCFSTDYITFIVYETPKLNLEYPKRNPNNVLLERFDELGINFENHTDKIASRSYEFCHIINEMKSWLYSWNLVNDDYFYHIEISINKEKKLNEL